MIQNWEDYEQLFQLLQKFESILQIESVDLLQALLTLDYEYTWIKDRALELVEKSDKYWKITK